MLLASSTYVFILERMTSLPVLVLGLGIVRSQSIGCWVLGAEPGIVLTLLGMYKTRLITPILPIHCGMGILTVTLTLTITVTITRKRSHYDKKLPLFTK